MSIDGAPGYFGTDGTRYATYVYVRGRYAFEVLVTGNGRNPKEPAHIGTRGGEGLRGHADSLEG